MTENTPDLIAICGDWHCDLSWARRIVKFVKQQCEADLCIVTGDFGYWPRNQYGQKFIHELDRHLAQLGTDVWFVDGNHEDFSELNKIPLAPDGRRMITEHIYHLPRGHRWSWDGAEWLALGGAASVNADDLTDGWDWFPDGEIISDTEAHRVISDGPAQVMITHDAPLGVAQFAYRMSAGSAIWPEKHVKRSVANAKKLANIIQEVKPEYLFHGHHHHGYTEEWNGVRVTGLDCNGGSLSSHLALVDTYGNNANFSPIK